MIGFKNIKYKPDKDGLWWFLDEDGKWNPAEFDLSMKEVSIIGVEHTFKDAFLYRLSKEWISHDEYMMQIFEQWLSGIKDIDPEVNRVVSKRFDDLF